MSPAVESNHILELQILHLPQTVLILDVPFKFLQVFVPKWTELFSLLIVVVPLSVIDPARILLPSLIILILVRQWKKSLNSTLIFLSVQLFLNA